MLYRLPGTFWAGAGLLVAGTGLLLAGLIMGQPGGGQPRRPGALAASPPALPVGQSSLPSPAPAADTPPLRFQVLAHSDHPGDQTLKIQVRDAVLPLLQRAGREARDAAELVEAIPDLLPSLERAARQALAAAGSDQEVRAVFGRFPFPERQYGGMRFPAGEYPTLRLVLGEGAGQNWWCLVFPPLCFPEAVSHVEVREPGPDDDEIAAAMAAAGAPLLLDEREVSELPVEARWALVDWLRRHGWLGE